VRVLDLTSLDQEPPGLEPEEEAHHAMLRLFNKPEHLVSNVSTSVKALELQKYLLPLTINFKEYDTSYVTSVYTAFISYAREELKKIDNFLVRMGLLTVIFISDFWLKFIKIDQVVSCNNFLLSTNLYPNFHWKDDHLKSELKEFHESVKQKYPSHAIIFRSLNEYSNSKLISVFESMGFKKVPSRQVYIFDKKLKDFTKTHNLRMDKKLFDKDVRFLKVANDEIMESDYARIVELYNLLYLDKYSKFNPAFTVDYIRQAHALGLIKLFGLRSSHGILEGIVGCYDRYQTTTAPIVGYNTALPAPYGLYRMLMYYVISRADRLGLILNLSSGASNFKLLRGGVPFIEVSAVYTSHLQSLPQRLTWRALALILTYVVGPILKYYKL